MALRKFLLAAAGALACTLAAAAEPCRVAFDIGSSGIRGGASNSAVVVRASIDYLASLRAGRNLDDALEPTITALSAAKEQGLSDTACARVGGGFSAWRLAAQQDFARLLWNLANIHAATGVAVLVIPQHVEGAYGYFGARQLLGRWLGTSHVLDIGGGSLQVSGEQSSFGLALGQKTWHQQLCLALRKTSTVPCALQPMNGEERLKVSALAAQKLHGIGTTLPDKLTMTAISRPVTQGVAPAVERLLGKPPGQTGFSRAELRSAIEQLAHLTLEETAVRVAIRANYAAYLLSDMLLVDGLMQATGGADLQIAEIDLTNLPGLLADDQAFRWVGYYGCYLERLGRVGVEAYASDPATCALTDGSGWPNR